VTLSVSGTDRIRAARNMPPKLRLMPSRLKQIRIGPKKAETLRCSGFGTKLARDRGPAALLQ